MVETRKILLKNTMTNINDDGTITLAVVAKTNYFSYGDEDLPAKKLSTDLADYFITQLEKVNSRLRSEKARNNRIFIETRYNKNFADLDKAEENLKDFQEKYGAVALPEQT